MNQNSEVYIASDVDPSNDSRSAAIKELAAALAKAQGEFVTARKNNTNSYYKRKYEDLSDLVNASRPALTKNGLSVIQQIRPSTDGRSILHTILMHSSGQWIETQTAITPPKSDIQTIVSHLACLKRMAYGALVGVVANDDDDGEIAMISQRDVIAKGPARGYKVTDSGYETITVEQREAIEDELSDPVMFDYVDEILNLYKIQNLADLPKDQYGLVITRIREIKKSRNGR